MPKEPRTPDQKAARAAKEKEDETRVKRRAWARAWKAAHPESRKKYYRSYAAKGGPERDRERYRLKLLANPELKEKVNAVRKAKYWEDPEKYRAINRAYALAAGPEKTKIRRFKSWRFNRATHLLSKIKQTAIRKGVPCDLTKDWLASRIAAGFCEMSGLPFDMDTPRGPNSPSVDRINPRGGYTQANCRVVLWYLNRAMSNLGNVYAMMVFRAVVKKDEERRKATKLQVVESEGSVLGALSMAS